MSEAFTIAAIATPPAAGGIGILRVSGPAALRVTARLAPGVPQGPEPRRAYFTDLTDATGAVLDQGLFLYFQGPRSFTGEDVVELQAHGSPRLLELLLRAVLSDTDVRPARPGEFTRRAFLNGRLDLARAEAIADLVSAQSEAAVRAAAAQVRGALSEKVRGLRAPLVDLHADLEGALDFPDEAEGAEADAAGRLAPLIDQARALLAQAAQGTLLRRSARVVLYGPVNAGKSTLFNRVLGQARALVDPEPGTTRDVLEAPLELDGLPLTLVDTAGLREEAGRVEALGIERAREALRGADLAVLVIPPEASAADLERWRGESEGVRRLEVWSKADVPGSATGSTDGALRVSGLSGEGVDGLRRRILALLGAEGAPDAVLLTSERHADALRRAAGSMERALSAFAVSTLEVASGEVGLAVEALGEITGESASEDLIDAIFRRFCIGK
jgi:tRNA modification GTPase